MTELFRVVRPSPAHEYTGERMSEGHNLETEVEHFHRYYAARCLAAGLDVLDIASGEGYGSAMLAQVAASVVGVDLDPVAVAHAQRTYAGERLRFCVGSATDIPLANASVDLLVSFETLEHFADHDAFFWEAKRLLRPGGRIIISTPDRDSYSSPGSEPNRFHVLELNRPEFEALLGRHFLHTKLFAQRVIVGSALVGTQASAALPLVFDRRSPSEVAISAGIPDPRYLIAVGSDAPLGPLPDSLSIQTSDIAGLTQDIPWLRQEIAERIEIQARERAEHAEIQDRDRAEHAKIQARDRADHAELQARDRADHAEIQARDRADHAEAMRAETAAHAHALDAIERQDSLQGVELQTRLVNLTAEVEHYKSRARRLTGLWPRAELQSLKLELDRQSAELVHAVAEHGRVAAAHDAITRSALWRLATRLRALAAHQPRLVALAVRVLRAARLLRGGRLRARKVLQGQRQADIAVLAGHALFDRSWYAARYLSAQPGADPAAHYVWVGAAAGHDPHPLFSTAWYAARHPGLGLANPFADYLGRGMAANEDPHPLFDAPFYCTQAPEASGQALRHYASRASGDPRCPTRFFDAAGYVADNPDAAASPLDPVTHFITVGAAGDRDPHALFDTAWYRRTHLGGAAGINPLAHWLHEGAAAGLAPHPLFPDATPDGTAITLPSGGVTPSVSIIIPVYGRVLDTVRCLYAVARRSGPVAFEVILADDRPAAPIAPLLAWVGGLRTCVNSVNMGFLRNCNAAARLARGRYILFLNNDTVVHDGWLEPLVSLADSDTRIGAVGGKLLNQDGTVQEAGGMMPSDGWGRPYGAGEDAALPELNYVREVDVVIGASFLVRRDAFEAVGGFDDRYAPAYYEEFDLAFALRERGLRVMYQPASQVTHLDGSTYGKAERDAQSLRNQAKFCRKWSHALAAQPSFRASPFLARQRPAKGAILVMEDRVPEPDRNAGSAAIAQYVALLVSLGLRVVYYPHDGRAPKPYTAFLEQQGVEVLHHPVVIQDWIAENGRFLDYVWSSRPYVSGYLMDQLRRDTGAPILYLTHDLHFLREARRYALDRDPLALEEATRVREIELGIFAKVDCILTFSEDEAAVIRGAVPQATVQVLPLFFYKDTPVTGDAASFTGRRTLLFVGGFNHVPNVDAALWLVRDIMPAVWRTHPDACVSIVGSEPPAEVRALAGPRVQIAGHVPDLMQSYAGARISVNPLRFGAGVKGKIVASLAAGLPVVTTAIGNEGLRLEDGVEALIGDTPQAIAAHIATLLDDDARCRDLAAAGAQVIARRFSHASARTLVAGTLGLHADL